MRVTHSLRLRSPRDIDDEDPQAALFCIDKRPEHKITIGFIHSRAREVDTLHSRLARKFEDIQFSFAPDAERRALFDSMDLPDIDLCDAILRLIDNTLRAIETSMSNFESGALYDDLSKFQTVTSKLCQQDSKEAELPWMNEL